MSFIVKKNSKEEFYEIFCKWLETQNFPLINKEVLPTNCFVCYADEVPCYCIWMYFTDSKLAWLAFPASNKNVNYNKKKGGLEFLINYVCDYLKRKRIVTAFTTSGTESVISALENTGFEVGDSCVHYIKKL